LVSVGARQARETEENMKKILLSFMNVSGLILLAIVFFSNPSLGITPQGIQQRPQLNTSLGNVRIERMLVKEIGDSSITSSDGKVIRFDSGTRVFKSLNKKSKIWTAELHYVNGRLAVIYIR
jgi:hypothetical protein